MLLYCIAAPAGRAQATSFARRQNLISKSHSRTLARPFNSRSPVQQTVILDSSGREKDRGQPFTYDILAEVRLSRRHDEVKRFAIRAKEYVLAFQSIVAMAVIS